VITKSFAAAAHCRLYSVTTSLKLSPFSFDNLLLTSAMDECATNGTGGAFMLSVRQGVIGGFLVLALGIGAVGVVTAADDPMATIAARRDLMKNQGKQMGIINDFVEKHQGSAADVVAAAKDLEASAAKIPSLFPKGTSLVDFPDPANGKPVTSAKAVIWEKWDDFKKAADYLASEAKELAEVAEAGDTAKIGEQFGDLAKNGCGGCHTTFRLKRN
jgi:cytochrome c556